MYKEVEGSPRMTRNEACRQYPHSFILVKMDRREMSLDNDMITVLYVGDDYGELFRKQIEINDGNSLCVVLEGIYQQCTLGGVVVGG